MKILATPRTAAILAGLSTLVYVQIAAAQTTEPGAATPPAAVAADAPPSPPPPAVEHDVVINLVAPEDIVEPAADAAPPMEGDPKKNRLSLGGGGGYGLAFVTHPDLVGDKFGGPIFEFHLDYSLSPLWTVGVEFMGFESHLKRIGTSDKFQSAADAQALQPQAGATKDRPPNGNPGLIAGLPLHVNTLGAAFELTPMDYDGVYVGTTLGAAFIHGVEFKAGGALAARGGYRIRLADPLAIALEGGAHAHIFDEASSVIPYGQVQLRLFWPR